MSTKKERSDRATRRIIPVKIRVRQKDGRIVTQTIDCDAREDKRGRKPTSAQ